MAMITLWHGGKLESTPIRRYVGSSSHTFDFQTEEFSVDNFKSKIHKLGYPKYKLRYVGSIEDLPNELYVVYKMRDFKHLKSMALSKGFVNIFIEDKSKKSTPIEASIDNTNSTPRHGTGGNTHEAGKHRRKHVTVGPNRRDVPILTGYLKEFDEELQSTEIGNNANENANAADEHAPYEEQEIPTSVGNKCPSLSCDVVRYVKLIGKLSRDQREWVKDMGFRHMLKINITHIDPVFGVWITSIFDAIKMTLTVRDNISVTIDDEMVGWVLGIPTGRDLFLPEESDKKEFKQWKMKYKQGTMYGAITESVVYSMVLSEESNKKRFQRHFLLYTLGILLCPTQKQGWISSLHVYMLGNASKAYKYNWGKYVLDWLVKYREKCNTTKEGLGGCTLLLLVIYLDRIAHGRAVEWNKSSCRVRYWDQSDVDYALKSNTGSDGSYGAAEAMENVVYGQDYPTN